MITTITLNPAIDKTVLLNNLIHGGVNRILSTREDIGGKGINVTKVLNRLNTKSKASGFIGNKNKKKVFDLLDSEGLTYHFIDVDEKTRTNTKIVELDMGLTTDLNEQGFTVNEELFNLLKQYIDDKAPESNYIVFSGSVPRGLSATTYKELIELVKDKTLTVLDADGQLLIEGIHAGPYMIKPNIHELESAFNRELNTDEDVIQLSKEIIENYKVSVILVSMGGQGSLLITKDEVQKSMPIKVEVKSTVGAGDSMLAGMLYGIDNGLSNKEALAFATACGTLAVTKEGTQSFSKDEVLDMMKKVHIETL